VWHEFVKAVLNGVVGAVLGSLAQLLGWIDWGPVRMSACASVTPDRFWCQSKIHRPNPYPLGLDIIAPGLEPARERTGGVQRIGDSEAARLDESRSGQPRLPPVPS
jgi:hypothetical protein